MRTYVKVLLVVVSFVLLPSMVHAQATIAGVVKDSSGAVLPGVTVEASSPALIEKVRTVITDGTGQYKIVNLVAGTYSLKFTLPGFNTIERGGVILSGDFAASINADMKVGAIEETITVTGETPIVDIQSSRQQSIINKDVLDAIPTARSHNQIVSLIPGVTVAGQDVGGSGGIQTPGAGAIHGGTSNDGRLQSDGMNVGYNGGSANMWMSNTAAAQETVVSTSGGLGEAETGGVVVNVVPRDGGNQFKGTIFANYAGEGWAADNFSGDLKTQNPNLKINKIQKVYDFNPMFGGPIVKDRLWFFVTSRTVGAKNYVAGMFVNKNSGAACVGPTSCVTPNFDQSQQAVTDNRYITGTIRLTAQPTAKNKFAAYYDNQDRCVTCTGGGTATTTVEATSRSHAVPSSVGSVTWQSPFTNRLLLEAGYGYYNQRWGGRPRDDGTYNPQLTNFSDQAGTIPGLSYRQPGNYQHNWTGQQNWRASASYVTGAHSMKAGYYGAYDQPTTNTDNYTGFSNFQFNNGTANRMTQLLTVNQATLMKVNSLYVQDQWTRGRMTLQGGIRFDHGVTEFTGGDRADLPTILPGVWLKAPITFSGDDLKGTNYKDITPRAALSYDLFGDGKTAIKVVAAKYVTALNGSTNLNPISRTATNATRSWVDSNKDYVPQCNFLSTGSTNLDAGNKIVDPTIDACGAISNPAFGTSTLNSKIDTAAFNGWNVRPYEWDFSVSVQRQIAPRVSVNVGYFRRIYGNFSVTDNLAVAPSDFDSFKFTAAPDPRLPGGGGNTITGLYNVTPTKFSSIDNRITLASNYGNQIQHWNGFDVVVNGRLRSVTFQGGTSTGRDSTDSCEIRAALPETAPTNPYCHIDANWLTQFKGLASYVIPRIDVNIAATFQSIPNYVATGLVTSSPGLAANQNVTAAQTNLGRAFAGGAANVSVNLVEPGTLYGDRINQLDFRIAKILRYGHTRTQVGLDLYNLTNSNAVQTYQQAYTAGTTQWLTPTAILQARFAKISAQFDW